MTKIFKIKEIFKSIQGEGFHSGAIALFLRFTGCNLWNGKPEVKKKALCNFCDTDFVGTDGINGGVYHENDLVEKVELVWNQSFSRDRKFIVLTGGEPLLQVTESLVSKLKELGYYVAIETNGSITTMIKFDWVCVSPKVNSNWCLKSGDELKIVFPQSHFNLLQIKRLKFKYFFLQPMDGEKKQINTWNTINYCKSHKPWFPSFQIHKILNIS